MDVRRALDKAGQAGVCKKGWVECGRGQLEIEYRKSFVYFDEERRRNREVQADTSGRKTVIMIIIMFHVFQEI